MHCQSTNPDTSHISWITPIHSSLCTKNIWVLLGLDELNRDLTKRSLQWGVIKVDL